MSEDEFVPRAIPRVRVVLYGPSNSGKSRFLNALLQKSTSEEKPTKEPVVVEATRAYKRRTAIGTFETVTNYKLTVVDTPGSKELRKQRMDAVKKSVIWILFYDSTSPESANDLYSMVKDELEKEQALKSAIAIIVLGSKGDLGPNPEALKIGEDVAKYLSKVISYYGYEVPHFVISCLDQEDVNLAFACAERLNFELKLPEEIVIQLKSKSEHYLKRAFKTAITMEAAETKKPVVPVAIEKPEALDLAEQTEGIPLPPLPEVPEEAERVFHESAENSEIRELIGGVTEVPEIKTPEPIPKVEEITVSEEQIPVIGEPEAIPQIILSPDESSWKMVGAIQTSIKHDSIVYIVNVTGDKLLVARGEKGKNLSADEEVMIRKLLSLIAAIDDDVGTLKAVLIVYEGLCTIIRGEKILILKMPRTLAKEALLALTKIKNHKNVAQLNSKVPPKPNPIIEWTQQERLNRLMCDLRSKIEGCEPIVIIFGDKKMEVAYAGSSKKIEEQKEFVLRLLIVDEIVSGAFPNYQLVMMAGSKNIVMLRGSKGILALTFRGTPPTELLEFLLARFDRFKCQASSAQTV